MNDATKETAHAARLRLLWLRVEQLDALYDRAVERRRLIKALEYARMAGRASRRYLES